VQLFDKLQQRLTYLPSDQLEKVREAFFFAEKAHDKQKRVSGEDYINHPLAVAMILGAMRLDYESIVASLLHDVVEDTAISNEIIIDKFGKTVADLVDGVTKLSRMEFLSHAEVQAESFRKTILAMSRDIRVILIKLADRFHNAQTLAELPKEKIKRIAKETLDIYAPIANRLGMHVMAVDLENSSFRALYPWRCKIIEKALEKTIAENKLTSDNIEQSLHESLVKNGLNQFIIYSHHKNLYGIYKAMLVRKLTFTKVVNKYSFRVIVDTIDACYRAFGVIHGLYKPIPGKFKDYIAIPKINGYQGLHTALFASQGAHIEIQIRTQAMEHRANYGIAAHWLYSDSKKPGEYNQPREQRWINNLLEIQQNTTGSLEFIENVKTDLFSDDVYVFTPKGKIVELPRNATVIDFAYAISNEIGNHCESAKINQRFVPLSTVLQTGETVTIITDPAATPNPAWLNYVVTGRARSGIRGFLKSQPSRDATALGQELLDNALNDLGLSIDKIPPNILKSFLNSAKLKSVDELYLDMGLGNRFALLIAYQMFNNMKEQDLLDKSIIASKDHPLLIRGSEGVSISFAECCSPIPGEKIVGCLHLGKGLVVHSKECPNVSKLNKEVEQCIEVEWAKDLTESFPVTVQVEMVNQRGALASLAQAIAQEGANIDSVQQVDERGGKYALVTTKFKVQDTTHLEKILRHISNLPMVIGIKRKIM
jgi:GTP diphosphokinase / guanosine-3',5'-bis(diphosphate) 3'-diphosphatase